MPPEEITMAIKRMLPPDCSADIHQIIAKAMYRRYEMFGRSVTLSRAEMEVAADAEFGYDIDIHTGALLFRPLTEAEKNQC